MLSGKEIVGMLAALQGPGEKGLDGQAALAALREVLAVAHSPHAIEELFTTPILTLLSRVTFADLVAVVDPRDVEKVVGDED